METQRLTLGVRHLPSHLELQSLQDKKDLKMQAGSCGDPRDFWGRFCIRPEGTCPLLRKTGTFKPKNVFILYFLSCVQNGNRSTKKTMSVEDVLEDIVA